MKDMVLNFAILMIANVTFQLIELPQNQLPNLVQCFWCVVKASTVTFTFYGLNKIREAKISGNGS